MNVALSNIIEKNDMKGMMLWGLDQPLVAAEIAPTLPPVGDVFVKLKSAALNKRDYWITRGKYPGLVFPLIPGSDGAGYVNDREVVINPGFNWGDDPIHFGPGFKILGMPANGTLAEFTHVPEQNIYDKPVHLTWAEAAALPVAGVTAYRAIFTRGRAKSGERMLVTGIGGGVATMALLFGLAAGLEVWVSSSSDEKISKAMALGAKGGINYSGSKWNEELLKTAGKFDLIIDGAGGAGFSTFPALMESAGRIVIYGGTVGPIPDLSPQRIFWKQLDVLGSTMGSPEDFANMLSFVIHHQIRPVISHTFPLDAVNDAIQVVAEGKQFGKVCIEIA
jgi:NADPH:quinone reductase-like Zn-dependent oxidoreductase